MTSNIKDIKESLTANNIIGLVIPDIEYDEMLLKVADAVSKDYNKILYLSVNKPYKTLTGKFNQYNINLDKFYFIDCITRTAEDITSTKNCIYVSSPRALYEIQGAINIVLRKPRIDLVLIDSPSALLPYYESVDVLKFMHLLVTKIIVSECKGIFPFQKESGGPLRRSIEMFVDEVVHLSGENGSSGAGLNNQN